MKGYIFSYAYRWVVAFSVAVGCCIPASIWAKVSQEEIDEQVHKVAQIKKGELRFSRQVIRDLCRFLEHEKAKTKDWSFKVFESRTTGLPFRIFRVPSLKNFVIQSRSSDSYVGKGCHKIVRKAILYGSKPRLIVVCDCDKTAKIELKALKQLGRASGLVPFLGYVERKKGKSYSLFFDYYSSGSLSRMLRAREKFTSRQVLKISKDMTRGLMAMHKKNLVHRDLHWGNLLLRPTKDGLYEAAITDFGKTEHYKKVGDGSPHGAKTRHPPEALLQSFKKLDRFAVDVYALGCTFYQLIWRENHPWAFVYNAYDKKRYGRRDCLRRFRKIVNLYDSTRDSLILPLLKKKRSGEKLSSFEDFKCLTFRMLDYQPKRRPKLEEVFKQLDTLAPEL